MLIVVFRIYTVSIFDNIGSDLMLKKAKSKAASLIGQKAPSLALPATGSQLIDLADIKGQIVVLYFYPRDRTPGCTLEGQDFTRLAKKFKKCGATILGVSADSIKSHESFRNTCKIEVDLIEDTEQKLSKAFDVIQMKSLYGKQYLGIERSTFVIDQKSVIRAEWRKVRALGHAEEVLEFVKTLV
jgi:peroxiredoxin Q/BCP